MISALDSIPNPPVLFYSREKFDSKKMNPGLVSYISDFIDNSRKTLVDTCAICNMAPTPDMDQDGDGAWDDGRDSPYYYRRTVLRKYSKVKWQKGPLLTTYRGQGSPYNNECPSVNGYTTPAGCVAIAIGQIINYNRKDYLKSYNWYKINHSEAPDIGEFIHDIGLGVHMDYELGGSGASSEDASNYIRAAGYDAHLRDYNYASLKECINQGKPVYLSAFTSRRGRYFIIRWGFEYSNGHAWVADGYKQVEDYEEVEEARGRKISYYTDCVKSTNYIHMNLGWGIGSGAWRTYDYFKIGYDVYRYEKK